MGHGFGACGPVAGGFPPGQEVEDFRPRVLEGVRQPRRDVDQGAVPRDHPLPDLADMKAVTEVGAPSYTSGVHI